MTTPPASAAPAHQETIYVAPGNNQCRVYAMPYHMRPGQKPGDIGWEYQLRDWKEIGLLDSRLKVRCIEPAYAHLKDGIEGLHGGSFMELTDGKMDS